MAGSTKTFQGAMPLVLPGEDDRAKNLFDRSSAGKPKTVQRSEIRDSSTPAGSGGPLYVLKYARSFLTTRSTQQLGCKF